MTPFAEFLKKYNLTASGVAKKAGLYKSQTCEYARGLHNPTRRTLTRISVALGIPMDQLLKEVPIREKYQNHPEPPIYCLYCHRKMYRVPSSQAQFEAPRQAENTAHEG